MENSQKNYRNRKEENFFGVMIENPKVPQNSSIVFRTAAGLGSVDFIGTIGTKYHDCHSNVVKAQRILPCWNFPDFKTFHSQLPMNCIIVGAEIDDRSVDVEDFVWPERCVLLLGNESNGLTKEARKGCHKLIKLPNPRELSFNLAMAGSMIMYDRYYKRSKMGV
jgi:tRNA G18 (ribose-2'-O)-methylase SpoU